MFILNRGGLVAAVVACGLALGGPASGQTMTFKIGSVDAEHSHSGVGLEAFAEAVGRLSNGKMKVEVFHAGKLGNIPAQIANTNTGTQDMHLLYPEFLGTFVPESKVISLPYVFNNLAHLQSFYKSDLWAPANQTIESAGSVVIDKNWSWTIKDPRGFISVKPIFTPADMKGLKLRIWEAKSAIETWRGFGADTVVVPRPEMYLAFKQGIIEGGPETMGIAYDQKNVELAKYWVRTEEYYQIINVIMNKARYNSLTQEQKDILQAAMAEASKVFVATTEANYEAKRMAANLEYGVTAILPALKPWQEAGAATIKRLEADGFIPAGFIDKIRALDK